VKYHFFDDKGTNYPWTNCPGTKRPYTRPFTLGRWETQMGKVYLKQLHIEHMIDFGWEPFKRATDWKSDITKERHTYCIKRATLSWG